MRYRNLKYGLVCFSAIFKIYSPLTMIYLFIEDNNLTHTFE